MEFLLNSLKDAVSSYRDAELHGMMGRLVIMRWSDVEGRVGDVTGGIAAKIRTWPSGIQEQSLLPRRLNRQSSRKNAKWSSNRGSTSGFRLRSGTHPIAYPVIQQVINLRKTPAVRG